MTDFYGDTPRMSMMAVIRSRSSHIATAEKSCHAGMAAMEGELLKFTGGGRGWQRRHFTLANGLLFYRKVGLERSVSQATQGVDTADEYRGCLLCSACTFVSSNSNDCRFDLK